MATSINSRTPSIWLREAFDFAVYCALKWPWTQRVDPQAPWVMGGHRGRAYLDNCAAVHTHLVRYTDQAVIWVTRSPEVHASLSRQGHSVLWWGSWEARRAILKAPVLIRSHGDGDLDPFLVGQVRPGGFLVHLNHCMNHLKAGQMFSSKVQALSARDQAKARRKIFAFDALLASSEKERANFSLSIPGRDRDIHLGGGAHLDSFFESRDQKPEKTILYFPTFRDGEIQGPGIDEVLQGLLVHEELRNWLKREGLIFQICHHINDAPRARQLPPGFEWLPATEVIAALQKCSLFISDYSGLLCDYLVYEKPALFFPYDLQEYLNVRNLYVEYEDFAFGEIARSVEELVAILTRGDWRKLEPHAARRNQLRRQFFPHDEPIYSAMCVKTIQQLLAESEKG